MFVGCLFFSSSFFSLHLASPLQKAAEDRLLRARTHTNPQCLVCKQKQQQSCTEINSGDHLFRIALKKNCNPLQRVIQGFLQQTGDYLLIKVSIWSWFWKTSRTTGRSGKDQVPATVMLPLLLTSTGLWGCENDLRSWPRRKLTALQPESLCSHTQMPSCRLKLSPTYLRNVPPSPGHSCDAGMQLAGNHALLFQCWVGSSSSLLLPHFHKWERRPLHSSKRHHCGEGEKVVILGKSFWMDTALLCSHFL